MSSLTFKFHHFAALVALAGIGLSACAAAPAQDWAGVGLSKEANTVYIANGTYLYAIDSTKGSVIWQLPPPDNRNFLEKLFGGSNTSVNIGQVYADPTLVGDTLIVTSLNKSVYALDTNNNGTLKWTYPEPTAAKGGLFPGPADPTIPADRLIAPATVEGDRIYIASADNSVYALDLQGKFQWRFETKGGLWGAVLPTAEMIYVPSMDHHLYAVNTANHTQQWDIGLDGALAGTPALSEDKKTIFVGTLSNTFYALDAATGATRWTFKLDGYGWVWSTPLVVSDAVYFADLGGNVYSVNALNGEKNWIWKVKHGESVRAALALAGDTLIVAADKGTSDESRIYAIKAADGTDKWPDGKVIDDKNADRLLSNPMIVGDTVVIVPLNADQLVYALSLSNGEVSWKAKP